MAVAAESTALLALHMLSGQPEASASVPDDWECGAATPPLASSGKAWPAAASTQSLLTSVSSRGSMSVAPARRGTPIALDMGPVAYFSAQDRIRSSADVSTSGASPGSELPAEADLLVEWHLSGAAHPQRGFQTLYGCKLQVRTIVLDT